MNLMIYQYLVALTVNDANDDIVRSANESEEGYEEWKERILKEAYTALNNKIS